VLGRGLGDGLEADGQAPVEGVLQRLGALEAPESAFGGRSEAGLGLLGALLRGELAPSAALQQP